MKIKALSFERDSFTLSDIKNSIADSVDSAGIYFESFSDANKFFEAVSDSVNYNDALILGIENTLYLKFKPILIKSLNLTPSYSQKILEKLPNAVSDEKLKRAHMLVPDEAFELLSDNGLYSGFYFLSEGKYIAVIPLKDGVSVELLKNSDLPFIKRKTISVVSLDEEPTDNILEKAKVIVKKLVDNDLKLAIPTTPAALTLQERLNTIEGSERVLFTPFVSDKGVTEPKEYSAELARGAKELKNCEIGATISTIFREKKGDITLSYYAFIGVAVEDKVIVRKLVASADESVPNLVKEASIELYNLIDKYIDELIFKSDASEEEIEKYENAQIESEFAKEMRPTASLSRQGMFIAIAILALAVLICGVVGFKYSNYLVSNSDEPETEVLQQVDSATQKTEKEESTTKPVSTTSPEENFSELDNVLDTTTTTSIFNVDPTKPPITYIPNNNNNGGGNNNNNNGGGGNNNTVTQKPKPSTTKPKTDEPEMEDTTKDDTPDIPIIGEMS